MKVEDLSQALIATLKETAKQYCKDVERKSSVMIYAPIFYDAELFEIRLGVWGPDYRDRGNGCAHIVVACYLFEEFSEMTVAGGIPRFGPRSWVIRFHPKSELKPTGRLSVETLEQQLFDSENEPQSDRVRSDIYCQLFVSWDKEVTNLEKLRIVKPTV